MLQRLAGWMLIEQPDLGDGRRANKAGALIELGASFHAAAAGDAARNRISSFLFGGINTRAGPKIVSAIHRDPGFYGLQILEDHAAVDGQIAHDRKLAERLHANW